MKRTPKKNTMFIKKWYKPSTIPRLIDYDYHTKKQIDECPLITEWLDLCFNAKFNTGYVQDHLFHWIETHKEIILLRKTLTEGNETLKFSDFLSDNYLFGETPNSKS